MKGKEEGVCVLIMARPTVGCCCVFEVFRLSVGRLVGGFEVRWR